MVNIFMKRCTVCAQEKPVTEFYKVTQRGKTKPIGHCKACSRVQDCRPQNRIARAKAQARNNGLKWELTLEQYAAILAKGCTYCGASLMETSGTALDRRDPRGHYTLDNADPCCWTCNYVKRRMFLPEEMREIARLIVKFRAERAAKGLPPLQPPEKYSARPGHSKHFMTRYRELGGFEKLADALVASEQGGAIVE